MFHFLLYFIFLITQFLKSPKWQGVKIRNFFSAQFVYKIYYLNGNFIKEWPSIEKAQKELYIHSNCIRAVCYGRSKTIGGFIWKFKGDELKLKDHVNLNFKPIVQYDLKGNKIKEWNSIKEAANKFDVSHSCISTAISGYRGKKNAAGFVWKFKNKI